MASFSADQPRKRFHLLALALITAMVGLPIVMGRVLSGQDIVNYLIIAQQTAANFREGLFFPAWAGGFNAGYGSPLLMFFPPLTGAINAIPILFGIPAIIGVCSMALVAHFLSGAAFYGWLRAAGVGGVALPAAIVYATAPYRLVNLYLRSALAEHWAFIWPPLIMWIASDPRLRAVPRMALLSLAVAALLLTNTPLAVLFGIGLAAWFGVSQGLRGLRPQILVGAGLGFAVASFTLVPQALAASFLNLDLCFGPAATRLRPSANTLFAAGFERGNLNTFFSLTLLATFFIAVLAYVLLPPHKKSGATERGLLAASILCVLVTLGPAGPVWDVLPIVSRLQFPWRITALLTLLAAATVTSLKHRQAWLVAALTAALSIPFASWDRTVPRSVFSAPEPPVHPAGTVLPDPHTAWEASSGGWYWRHDNLVELCLVPLSMTGFFFDEFRGAASSRLDAVRHRPATVVGDPVAAIRVLEWGQTEREVEVESDRGGTLVWRIIWFPGMRVAIDGFPIDLFDDSTTGLIAHGLPPGSHRARWSWRPFPALKVARGISLAALGVVITLSWYAVIGWWRRFKSESQSDHR